MDATLLGAEGRRQLATDLRAQARSVLVDTGLLDMLNARFGEAVITGSAGYDLMVWRDIDIHMPCESERWAEWAGLCADIAIQFGNVGLQLHKASYLNDYVEPHPLGAGLYWGLEFADFAGNRWKCDIWGWEPFDFAVRQARDANLRADLDRCDRDLILRLKHEARARPGYYGVMVGVSTSTSSQWPARATRWTSWSGGRGWWPRRSAQEQARGAAPSTSFGYAGEDEERALARKSSNKEPTCNPISA